MEETIEEIESEDSCFDDDGSEVEITKITKIPVKSKEKYDNAYREFKKWCLDNEMEGYSESVLTAYFLDKSKIMKGSSLCTTYSMLKSTLSVYHNIDISKYSTVLAIMRHKATNYKPNKSKILTRDQIRRFLLHAPDEEYLMMKVVLIFGISGVCRRQEMTHMQVDDVLDLGTSLQLTIREKDNKTIRTYNITDCSGFPSFLNICRKYMLLRPLETDHKRFFVYYNNGKCTRQVIGKDIFGRVPSKIAAYLNLPDPKLYTGRCFRRSSTVFANNSKKNISLSKTDYFATQFADVYVENSEGNKIKIFKREHTEPDPIRDAPANSSNSADESQNGGAPLEGSKPNQLFFCKQEPIDYEDLADLPTNSSTVDEIQNYCTPIIGEGPVKEEPLNFDLHSDTPTNSSTSCTRNEVINDANRDHGARYSPPQVNVDLSKETGDRNKLTRPNIYITNCKGCVINIKL